MKKLVYLIHGWEGYPENNWFPWLKNSLEQNGFEVIVPAMPNPATPKKSEWVNFFKSLVPDPDEQTYFVGHSMGCNTILRYLEALPSDKKVGGAVFVAGWVNLPNWDGRTPEEVKVVEDWVESPVNFKKVLQRTNKFVAIFSEDDPYFLKDNVRAYKEQLGAEVITKNGFGHFSDDDGIKELPEVLQAIIRIST